MGTIPRFRLHQLLLAAALGFCLLLTTGVASAQTDAGENSSLFIASGTLNGHSISEATPYIGIAAGDSVTGTVQVTYENAYENDTILILTPDWGDRESACTFVGTINDSAGTRDVPVSVTPPSTPGVYRLWMAFRDAADAGDVCSSTFATAPDVYGDHNDIYTWEQSEFLEARADGRVREELSDGSGLFWRHIPATVVNINVKSGGESAPALADGLHAYYDMEGDFDDDVGGHNGIVEAGSPTFTTGLIGQAADFSDGAPNTAVQADAFLQSEQHVTFAFWARFDGDSGAIVSWPAKFGTERTDTAVEFKAIPRHEEVLRTADATANEGEWHHVAFVVNQDGNIADFYVDGQYRGSTDTAPSATSTPYVALGTLTDRQYSGFATTDFDGQLDDLGIWTRLLSEDEIAQLYNDGAGRTPFDNGPSATQMCYAQIEHIPAVCENAELTQDVPQGSFNAVSCRLITCTSPSGVLDAKVCNKPGWYTPEYFEMYVEEETDPNIDLCIAGTCFDGWNFRRSPDFPLCTETPADNGTQPPGNGTDQNGTDGNQTGEQNETEPPPQDLPEGDNLKVTSMNGLEVQFQCAPEFDGQWTDWNFGDATAQDTTQTITHTFTGPGRYGVWCGSASRSGFESGYLVLTVQDTG